MSFKALAMNDLDFLIEVCGPGRVIPSRAALDGAVVTLGQPGEGEALHGALIRVAHAGEVARVLKYAFEQDIPVAQAGPGAEGAAPTSGFTLDLSAMRQVLELDPEALTLTVEPGLLMAELAAEVEAQGCFYPCDPADQTATVASQINRNADTMPSGDHAVTRDFVLGLEVVLPNGEIMELGGKDARTSSGHAFKDLIVGAGGSLGVVTKAILRLAPLPRKALSLLVPFPDAAAAMAAVGRIAQAGTLPTAIEFMLRDVLLATEKGLEEACHERMAEAYLLLAFDGATHPELGCARERVSRLCMEAGALNVLAFDAEAQRDAIWQGRSAFLDLIKASLVQDRVALGA